ncbi:Hypothetical protein A7982_03610 [Minicystis rosea]|nr:Hypothetical protein A7982_03610 [Minicystis rosea]
MGVEYEILLLPRAPVFVAGAERIAALVERLRADAWVATPESPGWIDMWRPRPPPEPGAYNATGGWTEPFIESPRSLRERADKRRAIPIPADSAWFSALRDANGERPQADELALEFSVGADDWEEAGLRYPFAYGDDEPGYHTYRILAARDFVRHGAFERGDTRCGHNGGSRPRCETDLAYTIDETRVAAPIDGVHYLDRIQRICPTCGNAFDPSSRAAYDVDAGVSVIFRFAVVIDCHKGWPRGSGEESPEQHASFRGQPARSVYGDPAPAIAPAFMKAVEESIGTAFYSVPNFF